MKSILTLAGSLIIASALPLCAADAQANWDKNCAQCHGKDGRGDTKMGKQLQAMDLTDAKKQSAFTDAQAATAIKEGIKENGKTKMKAFGEKLSDDEVNALVTFVRGLKK